MREEQFRTQVPKLRLMRSVPLAPGEEWGTRADFSPLVERRDIDFAPRHTNVVEETRRTFRRLKAEPEPDIVLVGHPQAMFAGTMDRMRNGDRPHPLLNGADAWTRQLAMAEADFERRVAQDQGRR